MFYVTHCLFFFDDPAESRFLVEQINHNLSLGYFSPIEINGCLILMETV